MERVGAVNIFERSIMKHSLRYTAFYGDGDCKSFKAVEKVYGDNYPMVKYECIGHYQKRLGNRLRKLRKVKNLGGKNRLVKKKIDTLQNYFGIALRDNVGNLDAMTTAIMASMYHVSDYHADTKHHKSKGALPIDVRSAILPVYNELTKPEMLGKCLHGKTQNANESFNAMIWERIPKTHYVGLKKIGTWCL